MKTVNEAIDRIEQCRPNFDYDEVDEYARLVSRFFAGMKAHFIETRRPLTTPLADSVLDESIHLPAAVV